MKKYRDNMVDFMTNRNTGTLSVNEFFYQYVTEYGTTGNFSKDFFEFNTEGISRCRRFITKAYGLGVRINADSEESYIKEYCLQNKI